MAVSEIAPSWVNDNGVPNGPNNACCSCLTLRIGTIIIALLSSFFDLFLFTWYSIAPSGSNSSSTSSHGAGVDFSFQLSLNVDMSLFTFVLIQLIVNICLIYGAFNRYPICTMPWLCVNSVIMVLILILLSFFLFFGYAHMSMSKSEHISSLIALGFIGACHLFSYFVVFQFRKNTLEEIRIMTEPPPGDIHRGGNLPSAPPVYEEVSSSLNKNDVKVQLEDETDEAPPDYDAAMQNKACTQRLLKKAEHSN